jgi:hypothetical protein
MSDDSVLEAIQNQMADVLLADPYFDSVPVIPESVGDIEREIEIALKKLGIAVIIVAPSANRGKTREAPGPYYDEISINCMVTENVLINRSANGTGKHNLAVAEHVAAILHLFKPDMVSETIYCDDPTIVLVPTKTEERGLQVRMVRFKTAGGTKYDIPQVADPIVSVVTGTATITCATSHAVIVYSTDGTPPSPRNTLSPKTALFYDAPFAVTPGQKILCKAYLPGFLFSKVVTTIVS